MSLIKAKKLEAYRRMVCIRKFEEEGTRLFTAGAIPGAYHASIGEEATIVGACMALRDVDAMTGTHRSHFSAQGADRRCGKEVVSMNIRVNLPKSGMGIDEGTVVRWLKAVGAEVQKGEVLVEIETAKALQEVAAPASGRLAKILVAAGETAAVNSALAVIEESLESV
jgi:TPP-dependent pyruvate/acetoin dehydrogenase alpha subunit